MNEIIGRIIGESSRVIRFRCASDKDIALGEILASDDEDSKRTFLLRVTEIGYGVEASTRDWSERTAGRIMMMEKEGSKFMISHKDERLYKIGTCIPLGCITHGKFTRSKRIPAHFSPVRSTRPEDYMFLSDLMGDLEVGCLRSGETTTGFPVKISGRWFPTHIGVFATTGMGKSNLMKVLAHFSMQSGKYGMLILDPHGEYYDGGSEDKKGLIHSEHAGNLRVYSARDLPGPHSKIRISAFEIEVEDLKNLYDFTPTQSEALDFAQRTYHDNWLLEIYHRDVETLIRDLRQATGREFFPQTLGIIRSRVCTLFTYYRREKTRVEGLVTEDKDISITRSVITALRDGKTVLIDTSGVDESEELLVSIVLARAILTQSKADYRDPERFRNIPPVLITFEEAQRLLGTRKDQKDQKPENIFAKIAREGRKFKVGLCAISQQPKLIDPEILSQFNTLIVLGLSDPKDREMIRFSAKQDAHALDNEIQTLMPGEGIVVTPYLPFPVPARFHLYEDLIATRQTKKKPLDVDPGFFSSLNAGGSVGSLRSPLPPSFLGNL